jgi:hypothetical protein
LCAAGATLSRPNGFWIIVALTIAIGLNFERLLRVCGPALIALGSWMLYNLARTGDLLTFLWAKRAWREVTLVGFLDHPNLNAGIHLALATSALGLVIVERHRLPRSWNAFTVLYLIPSLATGIVGMGRYANECFPPFAAAGNVLERSTRTVRIGAFTALVAGQAIFAYWIIVARQVP